MYFASPLAWWAFVLLAACAALAGALTYGLGVGGGARDVPSSGGRSLRRLAQSRLLLAALRGSALLLLLLVLFRPLLVAEQRNARGAFVPILVDQSRSMRIADVEGRRRIDVATDVLARQLLPGLARRFQPQVYGFGEAVSPASPDHLSAPDDRRTDLDAALRAVRDRYRDRPIAGVVVLSDGGMTDEDTQAKLFPAPVFTVGVGGVEPDREVTSVTAVESNLAASLVDLDASIVSRGFGSQPFDVRLVVRDPTFAAGSGARTTTVDVRHVAPADGVPLHVRFPVPPEQSAVLYSVEIPPDKAEAVVENNSRSVLVTPPGRKRRILFVQGSPGFEHSFIGRAWSQDPALEVDSVVRKGKNEQGQDAYFVQADPARAPALMTGYPTTRAALFGYDAIVFGSVEWDFFTRDQIAMTADFVRERGGGVLVLGARSFASTGLAGTPLDEALPLALASGRPSVALTANVVSAEAAALTTGNDNKIRPTNDGRDASVMRVASLADDNDRLWAALPPLAAVNLLGSPRPGASVLAVAPVNGGERPVVAVQRYGRGRTMEFTGEGSWRWKMLMPVNDRTHELFWRQVIRWLSGDSPDPVSVAPVTGAQPGATSRVDVLAVDNEFRPAANAVVTLRMTAPDGQVRTATSTLADQTTGRYSAPVRIDRPGVYRVEADARQGNQVLGAAERLFLAGGGDPEFADPRLNDALLQRIATESGGRYLRAGEAASLPDLVQKTADAVTVAAQPRDVWQHPLVFALIVTLLGAEWVLRRRRGLA